MRRRKLCHYSFRRRLQYRGYAGADREEFRVGLHMIQGYISIFDITIKIHAYVTEIGCDELHDRGKPSGSTSGTFGYMYSSLKISGYAVERREQKRG